MKKFTKFSDRWFTRKIAAAVNQAGPRYSPKVNVSLPINRLFYGLGRTDEFYNEFSSLRKEFLKEWEESSLKRSFAETRLATAAFDVLCKEMRKVIAFIDSIKNVTFGDIGFAGLEKIHKKTSKKLFIIDTAISKVLNEGKEKKDDASASGTPGYKDRLKHFAYEVRKIRELIYRVGDLPGSTFALSSNKRALLLLGVAGIGKTHLFCDIAEIRLKQGLPTILILGQQLQSINDPLEAIIGSLGLKLTKKQFLQRLNGIAKRRKRRVFLLIDAINEGDRRVWKRRISPFLKEIENYPGISVALSCRTPFDKVTLPKRLNIVKEYHQGFAEHELDALKIYANYYKLPLPEIPLLSSEFSNPLFLKLFCESLEKAVVRKQHKQIDDIASGQKGMTNIIEDVVIAKGAAIAKQFSQITPNKFWKMLKEDIASVMATYKRSRISLPELQSILAKYVKKKDQKRFMAAMISESLLSEDVYYDGEAKKYSEVIRFPYQKFSDHIVARHLFSKRYFDKNRIKECLEDENRLGWLFMDAQSMRSHPGLVEAFIVEFPTRINNKGELFDYIDKDKIYVDLVELFINGLYWRDPHSFNKSTDKWVGSILGYERLQFDILDVLVALATKPKHPYNAYRLDGYLQKFSMPKRDLLWSEYLRKQYASGTAYKLINWIESFWKKDITTNYAEMYILLLGWFLTSTNRPFRDRATRGLYYLGRKYPQLLFKATLESLKLNDPYIPERLVAASYGVTMALHYSNEVAGFNSKYLKVFARAIYKQMFSKKAKFGTTHILLRNYARRIVEISLLHYPKSLTVKQQSMVKPPFKCGGIRRWGESGEIDRDKWRNGSGPLHMDFENYTLGRLVPSRSNYDYEHEGYKKVKANILWRIYNLGYSHALFKDIDSDIANYNWNRSERIKVDRYGKKYSWIAFFELAGYREDKKLLPERFGNEAFDVDIDPSFPDDIKNEEIIKDDFIDRTSSVENWIDNGPLPNLKPYFIMKSLSKIRGPWALLDGFVTQEHLDNKRDIFIFIRGFLVPKRKKKVLLEALKLLSYPGNSRLPNSETDNYMFAGEIPWCETFRYCFPECKIEIPTGEKVIIREVIKKPHRILVIKTGDKEIRIPDYNEETLRKGFIEHEREKYLNFNVKLPVRNYSWSGETSFTNPGQSAYVPTKEICEYFGLSSRPQTFDMYDTKGRVASITRDFGDQWHTGHKVIYLRKSLLDKYLKATKSSFVWVVWGERRFKSAKEEELRKFSEHHPHYKVFRSEDSYN